MKKILSFTNLQTQQIVSEIVVIKEESKTCPSDFTFLPDS